MIFGGSYTTAIINANIKFLAITWANVCECILYARQLMSDK